MANRPVLPQGILILIFSILSGTVAFTQTQCTLRKDEDGIKVYTCNTDTSKFKSIRVECILKTSLQKLEAALIDFSSYTQWQFNTFESKSLKKISDSEFIYYAKIEAPWPVDDRDMVARLLITKTSSGMIVTANSEKGLMPDNKDYVRVPASRSQWIVTEKTKDQLAISYSIQIDPGGKVPAWLVNWVCANAPLQSFKSLKKRLEK